MGGWGGRGRVEVGVLGVGPGWGSSRGGALSGAGFKMSLEENKIKFSKTPHYVILCMVPFLLLLKLYFLKMFEIKYGFVSQAIS